MSRIHDIEYFSVRELNKLLRRRELSSCEIADRYLDRIDRYNMRLNAYVHVDPDITRTQAKECDISVAQSGSLLGIPVAVKDVICTTDMPTSCGSRLLKGHMSAYDAEVIRRLREAGAVILGKTNTDEFGMGSSTEYSCFGPTRNPWDISRVPGGSSGGSAAALAAGLAPLALGSDTGGSVRQPAAFCGIVGLKPTYGRVSRRGLVAYASSMEQIGVMARTVEDCRSLFRTIVGYDAGDSTSFAVPAIHLRRAADLKGLRLGIVRDLSACDEPSDVQSLVSKAVDMLSSMGADILEVSLPHLKYAVAVYYIVACSEASSNLERYDGLRYGNSKQSRDFDQSIRETRRSGFGSEVVRRILMGTCALSAGYHGDFYDRARRIQTVIAREIAEAWQHCDLLISPTAPETAFLLGERAHDPLKMYLGDRYTIPANLAGIPAMSIPCGLDTSGLPVGMQFMAPHFWEEFLMDVAGIYEQARGPLNLPLDQKDS